MPFSNQFERRQRVVYEFRYLVFYPRSRFCASSFSFLPEHPRTRRSRDEMTTMRYVRIMDKGWGDKFLFKMIIYQKILEDSKIEIEY